MLNSINLITQHMAAARVVAARCLNWIDATSTCRGVRLDDVISTGTTMRKRLQACKESLAETWDPSWTNNQHEYLREYVKKLEEYSRKYDEWLGRWQRARAEAEAVGLDGSITYDYWKKNIQLPDEVVKAYKWFDTVERVIKTADLDATRIVKFAANAYCSEVCHRFHWLGGHMHECPRADEQRHE